MNLDTNNPHLPPAVPIQERLTLLERMHALASRHIGSSDPLRVIERWIDDSEKWVDDRKVDGTVQWIQRGHPDYHLAFARRVRGQTLRIYVDYVANHHFLGLFIYWPEAFEVDSLDRMAKKINTINWNLSFGNFELDPNRRKLRFRFAIDVQGIRLTPAFLHFMLESGLRAMDQHATEFLPGPVGLVA